jgi:hypothetical protein
VDVIEVKAKYKPSMEEVGNLRFEIHGTHYTLKEFLLQMMKMLFRDCEKFEGKCPNGCSDWFPIIARKMAERGWIDFSHYHGADWDNEYFEDKICSVDYYQATFILDGFAESSFYWYRRF